MRKESVTGAQFLGPSFDWVPGRPHPDLHNIRMPRFCPVPIVPLETDRLLLRPTQFSDAPRIQELFDNFNLLRYMAAVIPWPYPETGAADYIASITPKMETHEMYPWSIFEKKNLHQGLIGHIALTPKDDSDNRGFWLAEPYWGQGYMSEAVFAVTDFAFGPLQMEYLMLNNAEANRASHRLKEKAGAEIVAFEERDYVGGRLPAVIWKLTAERWAQNRENFLSA